MSKSAEEDLYNLYKDALAVASALAAPGAQAVFPQDLTDPATGRELNIEDVRRVSLVSATLLRRELSGTISVGSVVRTRREGLAARHAVGLSGDQSLTSRLHMDQRESQEAYDQGYAAGKDGSTKAANPYDLFSNRQAYNFLTWDDGWQAAINEDGLG